MNGYIKVKLAGVSIGIHHLFPQIADMCADYLTDTEPELTITVSPGDIDYERQKAELSSHGGAAPLLSTCQVNSRVPFSDAYLETLAVYRKIAESLPNKNVLLFHGSVIAVDGEGYMFIAPSGTGKSTHTRLWREQFGARAVMVNDDKPLIRINAASDPARGDTLASCSVPSGILASDPAGSDTLASCSVSSGILGFDPARGDALASCSVSSDALAYGSVTGDMQAPCPVMVYGSPWDGKHHLSTNIAVPLRGIAVLERGETNYITRISRKDAYPFLCRHCYRPSTPDGTLATLSHIDRLTATVPVYRLACTPTPESALISYRALSTRTCECVNSDKSGVR